MKWKNNSRERERERARTIRSLLQKVIKSQMDAAQAATKLTAISWGVQREGGGVGFGIEQQHEACSYILAWRNLAHC